MSYFNELTPSERRAYWLGDSNLDGGQDTKRLAQAVKAHGWKHVKLAYFGTADPKLYGMDWSYWTKRDLQGPQSGWTYVINTEFLQLGPAYSTSAVPIGESWITSRRPDGVIGDTWYYFEIAGKVQKDGTPAIDSATEFIDMRYPKP
jgi:hypothetical protein